MSAIDGESVATALLAAGHERIEHSLGRQVSRGKLAEADMAAALARITMGTDYAAFGDCDLVIESVVEDKIQVWDWLCSFGPIPRV